VDNSFLESLKSYGYWAYLGIAGYVSWNHKRVDNLIKDQATTGQKVEDLKDLLEHVRQGVDRLNGHLIDSKNKK
jgi:hypothetical protein